MRTQQAGKATIMMPGPQSHGSPRGIPRLLFLPLIALLLVGMRSCEFEVSLSASPSQGGSVSGAGIYPQGEQVTVTANPNAGYRFVDWSEDGKTVSNQASYTFTVQAARALVATFAADNNIISTACSYTPGDSQKVAPAQANVSGGETLRPLSHREGSQTYHLINNVRQGLTGSTVSIDYMTHQPVGSPKGVVLLIPGGPMNAFLEGVDGQPATRSGGNFLIQSAHLFATNGYRAISIDRPSDYAVFGNIDQSSSLYDAYRNSMLHAVDLVEILQRENSENLPVYIAGHSRGGISAYANNTIATGMAFSAAVANPNSSGTPISSPGLPVTRNQRPTHILMHRDDGCGSTLAVYSKNVFNQLKGLGISVRGDEVHGGFRDTLRNDVCGTFDYHGFNGIETCAVGKITDALDAMQADMAAGYPGNSEPVASAVSDVVANVDGMDLKAFASDSDADGLNFSVPYAQTTRGGAVAVSRNGIVSYSAPVLGSGTDKFVYVVTDSKGGVGRAVVSVEY